MEVAGSDRELTSIQRLNDESDRLLLPRYHSDTGGWGQDVGAWETDSRIEGKTPVPAKPRPISPLAAKPVLIRKRRLSTRKRDSPSLDSKELQRNMSQRDLLLPSKDSLGSYRTGKSPQTTSVHKPPLPRHTDSSKRISEEYESTDLTTPRQPIPRLYKANLLTESSPTFLSKHTNVTDHSLLDTHKMREFLSASAETGKTSRQSPQSVSGKVVARNRLYS